jgi:hypothetical protein
MAWIEKRTRNGRVSYSVRYRDPAGHSRRKVFDGKVDAQRWLSENETAKLRGAWVDPTAGRDRFGEWADRWFATTAALRPTTRHDDRTPLDRQLLPAFGGARLADLDALAVREWLAGLVGAGLSAKRSRKAGPRPGPRRRPGRAAHRRHRLAVRPAGVGRRQVA